MDVRILIWTLILIQRKSHSMSISDVISEDVTFLHKTFPVPPSMRAIIQMDVSYPISSVKIPDNYPIMGIYTTNDHINIKKQCTYIRYGQLANQVLHPRIRLDGSDIQPPHCLKEGVDTIHCRRNVTIQDFKPRNFSFSFGFFCSKINQVSSLKGLIYNISIHGQTNETKCIQLHPRITNVCSQFYQYGLLPDLIGGKDMLTILSHWDHFKTYVAIFEGQCYQHFLEVGCYVVVPKCDPISRQVIHPCREMCHDFRIACSKIKLPRSTITGDIPHDSSEDKTILLGATSLGINCDYLPSVAGEIPCFYKPVTCRSPPSVKNAAVQSISMNYNNYSFLDTIDYSCNEGFQIEGNKKISCLYSGEWSTPPKCSLTSISTIHPLFVVLPVLLIPLLILFTIGIVRYKIKLNKQIQPDLNTYHQVELDTILMEIKGTDRPLLPLKRKLDSKRNSFFDAFVLYHFDSNNSFVVNHLLPELEEKRKFRLFIHCRNFIPGHDITQNIEEAIECSNSAIIVMSQGFVDSMWCKEEFTHCYIENMKDAAFNLFIIMMQPADTLVNMSNYIKSFMDNKTYLKVNDPDLFTKLATHLEHARQPEDGDVNHSDEYCENIDIQDDTN